MTARITRARHHKWPHVGRNLQQPFKRAPAVFHAEDIVDLKMIGNARRKSRLIDAMLNIVGHRLRRHFEDRRLIHVVPESRHPLLHKILVERAPPFTRCLLRKVRKHRLPRPHHAHIRRPIRPLHKMIARRAFVVGLVARVGQRRHVQIGNHHGVQMLCFQILNHLVKVRKSIRIHRERTILDLIINVQPDHVRRNMLAAQPVRNAAHFRFGIVTVARLLEPQRPQRRQRRRPCEPCPRLHHSLGRRTVKDVVVQRSAL